MPAKQEHTDKDIKNKMLKPFLQDLKSKYGVKCYLWVAEAQENGNIHFHILVDKFLDNRTYYKDSSGKKIERAKEDPAYQAITRLWNLKLAPFDYIKRYNENQLAKGNKPHFQPNSVDIHYIKKQDNVAAYITAYMTKEEKEKRPIEGQLWGCSDNLREVKPYEEIYGKELYQAIGDMQKVGASKVKQCFVTDDGIKKPEEMAQAFLGDGCPKVRAVVYFYPQKLFMNVVGQAFKERFRSFYAELFKSIYLDDGTVPPAMAYPQKKPEKV
ncbi:MAG: hypothetical protein HC913_14945 [Microscillaceae bacterium]|nr:hypothetical protein [Microscillaceae bacterium]